MHPASDRDPEPRPHRQRQDATILVVEDNRELAVLLTRILADEGYAVRTAVDGQSGVTEALADRPDLLILDVGLPRRDGFSVVRELRRKGLTTPTLMLTARRGVADRIRGLDAGADDYLTKPFNTDELAARVRALLRRSNGAPRGGSLHVGSLTLDLAAREARRGHRKIGLTQREAALLECFMRNAGRTLSRDEIVAQVWNSADLDVDSTNIVDVYVAYLRRKVDPPGEPPLIHTVRGTGYMLREAKSRRS